MVTAALAAVLFASLAVTAKSDLPTVEVGQEVQVQVAATGSGLASATITAPRAPQGVEIGPAQGPAMQRRIVVANGRQTQTETLVWIFAVTATHAGDFVVPPFVVGNGVETATSAPITIHATGSFDPRKYAFVETRVDSRPHYVGEPIVVDLVAGLGAEWIDRLVEGETSISAPWITDGLGNGAMPEPDTATDPGATGVVPVRSAAGPPLPMIPGREKRKDGTYAIWSARRSFVPARPGAVTVGPTAFRAVIATKVERDGIFRDRLFAAETKLAAVSATPVAIVVKPLPDAGRPDDFAGLVGRLALDVDVSPKTVKVGESIRVRVRVHGEGNLGSTALPKVDVAGFKRFGAVEEVDTAGEEMSRTMVYDLAPVSTDVDTIPAFRISFFDTASGTYRALASAPVRIHVLPGPQVSSIKDIATAPTAAVGSRPSPVPTAAAVATDTPDAASPAASGAGLTGVLRALADLAPWAAVGVPPALVAIWLLSRRSSRPVKPKAARRDTARKDLDAALAALPRHSHEAGAAIAAAFAHFLASLANLPPETFVGVELDGALAPWLSDVKLRTAAVALVARADAAAFGGHGHGASTLSAEARELASAIEPAFARFPAPPPPPIAPIPPPPRSRPLR